MPRVFKKVLPEQTGIINLPLGAKVLSVGFQKDRTAPPAQVRIDPAAFADPAWPKDDLRTDPQSAYVAWLVKLTDQRSGDTLVRIAMVGIGSTAGDVEAWYDDRGYEVLEVSQSVPPHAPATPAPPAANLVPVLWFEEPDTGELASNGEDIELPNLDVRVCVVPTGEHVPSGFRFVGTLQRPCRRAPEKDAVFHIYLEKCELLRFA